MLCLHQERGHYCTTHWFWQLFGCSLRLQPSACWHIWAAAPQAKFHMKHGMRCVGCLTDQTCKFTPKMFFLFLSHSEKLQPSFKQLWTYTLIQAGRLDCIWSEAKSSLLCCHTTYLSLNISPWVTKPNLAWVNYKANRVDHWSPLH